METKTSRIAQPGSQSPEAGFLESLVTSRLDRILFDNLVQSPVHSARPLLTLQRALQDGRIGLYISRDFREAQRHYVEALHSNAAHEIFVVHEMMPGFQQDYVMQCIEQARYFKANGGFAVFTSEAFVPQLHLRLPWLDKDCTMVSSGNVSLPIPLKQYPAATLESAVSCICLRLGAGNRLLLTDHETAAVIPLDAAPMPDLAHRLLRHVVNVQGEKLAPYLSLMFDVPPSWKSIPELATKCLLIFRQGHCATGCTAHGIPGRITWSETLGLVY